MSLFWKDVKSLIEAEIDEITWEEPLEVKMSALGVFPSGAGTNGQYLSNLFGQLADTRALGLATVQPAMDKALADPDISLENCKTFWKYMSGSTAHLLGGQAAPNCPAPWLNLPKILHFYDEIVASLPSVSTKEELADLLWSWFNYLERLFRWFWLKYPWELGNAFPVKTSEETAELVRLGVLPEACIPEAVRA